MKTLDRKTLNRLLLLQQKTDSTTTDLDLCLDFLESGDQEKLAALVKNNPKNSQLLLDTKQLAPWTGALVKDFAKQHKSGLVQQTLDKLDSLLKPALLVPGTALASLLVLLSLDLGNPIHHQGASSPLFSADFEAHQNQVSHDRVLFNADFENKAKPKKLFSGDFETG